MHAAYTTTTTKKTIATQWYTMNIDYKFICIWISAVSLSEYIVEMYLQQYDIASGGQWRPRMYFSWYTSSFILNDGVYDVIESINFSRSSANLQHFSTSTVYWCIASKLKAPWNFYWMSNMFLCVEIFIFFVCYHVVPKRHSQLDYELNGL